VKPVPEIRKALAGGVEAWLQDDPHSTAPGGNGDGLAATAGLPARLNLKGDNLKNGLARLVLTLVKLLHELLERQGLRRIEAGSLTPEDIERLGLTLMQQAQEIDRLRQEFGLAEEDLNIDLGPFGRLF
jgi:hypothetical protein